MVLRAVRLLLIPLLALSPVNGLGAEPLRFRITADPPTLDWNLARSAHETYLIMNLMEGLVEEGEDLAPRPALAEKWETSADGKTYRYFLRAGVKWSDGTPLRAQHFVDSWLRLLDPKTGSSYASFLFDIEGAREFHEGRLKDRGAVGVKAVGDSKLEVRLVRPTPHFPHLMTFWVTFPIRTDLIRKHGPKWAEAGRLVTLGPYVLKSWKRGKTLELSLNPEYFAKDSLPTGVAGKVVAIVEPDDQAARALFESGRSDFLLDATTQDLLKPKAESPRVDQFPYLATFYLGFNVSFGPLKDPAIRKALAQAIDRDAIPPALQGGQIAAKGWIPPGVAGFDAGAHLAGSLYEARGALAKAGFVEGNRFPKLKIWLERFDGVERLRDFLVKSYRERLGIGLEGVIVGPAEFQRALRGGKAPLFVSRWGADYPDPSNFFQVFASTSGTNYTGWKSEEYDRYLSDARTNLDSAARLASYTAAERLLLQKEAVILPLFYRRNTALLGPRIDRFAISPLNYLFLKNVTLKE